MKVVAEPSICSTSSDFLGGGGKKKSNLRKGRNVSNINNKDKAMHVTGRGGPLGCEAARLPHFLDSQLINGGEVSITRRPPLPPLKFLVLISVRGWLDPRAIVRLEGYDIGILIILGEKYKLQSTSLRWIWRLIKIFTGISVYELTNILGVGGENVEASPWSVALLFHIWEGLGSNLETHENCCFLNCDAV
jgi:hypothetical protein